MEGAQAVLLMAKAHHNRNNKPATGKFALGQTSFVIV